MNTDTNPITADDALYDQQVTAAAQSVAREIDNAGGAIYAAGRQLGDLTGCLFAIEWAEGIGSDDIRAHLDAAARSLRAAAALHRVAMQASGL